MPYIDSDRRVKIDSGFPPSNAGELTYVFYCRMLKGADDQFDKDIDHAISTYIANRGAGFQTFCDVLGALSASELEYRRRHGYSMTCTWLRRHKRVVYDNTIAPFEDLAITRNGDVRKPDNGRGGLRVGQFHG